MIFIIKKISRKRSQKDQMKTVIYLERLFRIQVKTIEINLKKFLFIDHLDSEQFYMRPPSRQNRTNESDDHYMADLIAQYGDADAAARRNWRESQQQIRSDQYQEKPSQNTKTQVEILRKYLKIDGFSFS